MHAAVLAWLVLFSWSEPSWYLAVPGGRGCWPPRCDAGQWPLALPVVTHNGRLFMLGDGPSADRVYTSTDGLSWQTLQVDAPWGPRYGFGVTSYRGSLWRVGGFTDGAGGRRAYADVWRSPDGIHWSLVAPAAPWGPKVRPRLTVFRDTLWLVGGEPPDSLAWLTTDGASWLAVPGLPAPALDAQVALVHGNRLWLVGGGTWEAPSADVWHSDDGRHWRQPGPVPWTGRMGLAARVFAGRLWILGGAGLRDVWSTSDGGAWHRFSRDLPGPPRGGEYTVAFRGALWVFGGKTGGAGGTGFLDEVWVLR